MVDLHIITLEQWDPTKDFLQPFIFVVTIGTNVSVIFALTKMKDCRKLTHLPSDVTACISIAAPQCSVLLTMK
jgi:hypothetical protein